ncbi:MAG: CHAT domain-containing protein [Caldilineales bacterium]|nr:CHAT domain-containing protein [Caldilineales bacterium]MCW5860304.1 CHAT domain-containing protein [Caldilineales bacterium]
MTTFHELDLRILRAGAGRYFVTAEIEGATPTAPEPLGWRALSQDDFVQALYQMREEEYTLKEATVIGVGTTLYDALFQGQVRKLFEAVYLRDVEPHPDTFLRLRLAIDEHAPEIAALPWEFLFWNGSFLATHARILLTRQLLNLNYGAIKALAIEGKPRLLALIPRGSGLDTDGEEQAIREILSQAQIPFEVLKGRVFIQDVIEALRAPGPAPFNILHFIGHGKFEHQEGAPPRALLRFNHPDLPDDGPAKTDEMWIDQMQIRQVVESQRDHLRLVILNACEGAEVAGEEQKQRGRMSGLGFVGMVPSLLMAGMPAVIAMQYEIRDDVAARFAASFYGALTSSAWMGRVDIAVSLARGDCFTNFKGSDWRGFGTPVLHLHAHDGVIFTPKAAPNPAAQAEPSPCPQPPKPDDSLLHDHRHSATPTLLSTAGSLREGIASLQQRIDYYQKVMAEDPLTAAVGLYPLQIERLKGEKRSREAELDRLTLVLCWRLYEDCLEHAARRQELTALEAERDDLQAQGKWVSYDLKNKISDLRQKLRELEDVLAKGRDACP